MAWEICIVSQLEAMEGSLLQRAVFVIDSDNRIVYVEYVADQLCEPDYATAMQEVQQADVE